MNNKKKIAVIGGGTGIYSVLTGLKKHPVDISAIVTMADSGGSTGVLREEFGILPPGDIRRALVALSESEELLCDLFTYRFKKGNIEGHSFGNLFLTALSKLEGDFQQGIQQAMKLLNVKGKVIPVTTEDVDLFAELENGQVIEGEANIDTPQHDASLKIEKVFLKPEAEINPRAEQALKDANAIIIGPGDLYTSIIPNLLVKGVPEAIKASKADKFYICNLMTKHGETHGFSASDFVNTIKDYLEGDVDYVLVNNKRPSSERIEEYEQEGAEFVDSPGLKGPFKIIKEDLIRGSGYIRHDPEKTAQVILNNVNT
ncbi:MAG: gluconeogenesis factor YvcK family protein [Candidatus Paceibacterota bacterium]